MRLYLPFVILFFYSICSCNQVTLDDETIIGVQPLGDVKAEQVDSISASIRIMYDVRVEILPAVKLPQEAYTTIRSARYRADSLVRWLSKIKADSVDIIVGLTEKDISITKYNEDRTIKSPEWKYKDFGIFGLGQIRGSSCVISSYRLHKGTSKKGFYKRLNRITCHEVGHVLGLRHCPEQKCLLNDANESIRTIDKSTGELCEKCWSKIR